MSEDEVEIIHNSQYLAATKQLNLEEAESIKKENQKLLSINHSLRQEAKQYKDLLQKSIENLKQVEKDQYTLKVQLSHKESQIQTFQNNIDEAQKGKQLDSQKYLKLKDSNSNRESFGNKLTNLSSADCEANKYSQISMSPKHDSACHCPYFLAQKRVIGESISKMIIFLKQTDPQQVELLKNLTEFEENVKQFGTVQTQIIEVQQVHQLEKNSLSDHFQSIEDNPHLDNQLFNEDLDTSQFDGELQIQQSFEYFEQLLNKASEEEKIVWKQKLLQLINSL